MRNKGFTLVELLAVIIILGIIALITFPVIDNSIKKSKEEALKRTIDAIEDASYRYSVENDIGYPDIANKEVLKLEQLQDAGFLEKDIINPVTNDELKGCVWYYYDDITSQYDFQYDIECEGPSILITYDRNLLHNDWLKANMLVNLVGTGNKVRYCISNSECEPNIEENLKTYSVGISNEGTNVVCAISINAVGESEKICESLKLDKTLPTAGIATINGTLGSNDWYLSDVTVNISDGSDDLSGHDKTTVNMTSVTGNTTGQNVVVTTTDIAGNSSSRTYTVKIDKDSPTITAKAGVVEINEGDNNVVRNYFEYSYSISGGSINCDPINTSTLTGGTKTVSCTVTGGNGKVATATKDIKIKSSSLVSILQDECSTSNLTGLVQDANNPNICYYKGKEEEVNNYLWYGGHQWRILEIDKDANTLTLISSQPLVSLTPNDASWTTEAQYNSSFINSWLNDVFYASLSDDVKNNIVNNTFNIGIYTDVDEITTTKKVGLLDEDQFQRGGRYLNIRDVYWFGNRKDERYLRTGQSSSSSSGDSLTRSFAFGVRPVIKINSIKIVSGSGTLTDSYKTNYISLGTNDVQVGEYISVPYNGSDNACGSDNKCTFRVVSKDNDSVKIILNGLLSTTNTYFNIFTSLDEFVYNISSNYKYSGDKIIYKGNYSSGVSYTKVKSSSITSNVGFPVIGEMFTGNDIDLGAEKIFVDVNTIENPDLVTAYWTTSFSSSDWVRHVNSTGAANYGNPSGDPTDDYYGVRPTIFLKNNLIFTGGDGTAQNPYTLN